MKVKTCECLQYVMSLMNKDVLFSLANNQYQNFITTLVSIVLKS